MKKALAIGLAAVMAVSMSAPVMASDDSEGGAGIAKEDLKIGAIYIGDENEGYTAAHMAGIDEMVENLGLESIRTYSSATQPEHRLHPADFPICTTTSPTFTKHVMYPVW